MNRNRLPARHQRGFTLPEILIALAIMTVMTLVTLGALTPWVEFRQKLETSRKLDETKEALRAYYRTYAYNVEDGAVNTFGDFSESVVAPNRSCNLQTTAFTRLGFTVSDAGTEAAQDGFSNPFCVLVGNVASLAVDGVLVYHRPIAIISVGANARLETTTRLNPTTNALELAGDDVGVIVNTLDLAKQKYDATVAKMERVAQMYETYFTTRFLQSSDREIARYYFNTAYDPSGSIDSTGAQWQPVSTWLTDIGVSPDLASTAWELNSAITVNNEDGEVTPGGLAPRGAGSSLPYTALLRARIPAPGGAVQYIARTAVGNY